MKDGSHTITLRVTFSSLDVLKQYIVYAEIEIQYKYILTSTRNGSSPAMRQGVELYIGPLFLVGAQEWGEKGWGGFLGEGRREGWRQRGSPTTAHISRRAMSLPQSDQLPPPFLFPKAQRRLGVTRAYLAARLNRQPRKRSYLRYVLSPPPCTPGP